LLSRLLWLRYSAHWLARQKAMSEPMDFMFGRVTGPVFLAPFGSPNNACEGNGRDTPKFQQSLSGLHSPQHEAF
jgi:hypothetical protein